MRWRQIILQWTASFCKDITFGTKALVLAQKLYFCQQHLSLETTVRNIHFVIFIYQYSHIGKRRGFETALGKGKIFFNRKILLIFK